MSHGPGHVQRKLAEIFAENRGAALTTSRLCLLIWGETEDGAQHLSRRSAVLRAAKTVAWKAGWVKFRVYDTMNENVFVEVTNPLAEAGGGTGSTTLAWIAKTVGANPRDVRRALIQGAPILALSVSTAPKLLTLNTYQGG
jgi:hypothetical protein